MASIKKSSMESTESPKVSRIKKRPARLNEKEFDLTTKKERKTNKSNDGKVIRTAKKTVKERKISLNTLRQKEKPRAMRRSNDDLKKRSRDYIARRDNSAYMTTITTAPFCKAPVAKNTSDINVDSEPPSQIDSSLTTDQGFECQQNKVIAKKSELKELSAAASSRVIATPGCSSSSDEQAISSDFDFTNENNLENAFASRNDLTEHSVSQSLERSKHVKDVEEMENLEIIQENDSSAQPKTTETLANRHINIEEQDRKTENAAANKRACPGDPGKQGLTVGLDLADENNVNAANRDPSRKDPSPSPSQGFELQQDMGTGEKFRSKELSGTTGNLVIANVSVSNYTDHDFVVIKDSQNKPIFKILRHYKTQACKSDTFKTVVKNLAIALLTPEVVMEKISEEEMDKYAAKVNLLVKMMLYRLEPTKKVSVLRILIEGENMRVALKGYLDLESKEALEIMKSAECKTEQERRVYHYNKLETPRVVKKIMSNAFKHFRSEYKTKQQKNQKKVKH